MAMDARIEIGQSLLGNRVLGRLARPRQHYDNDDDADRDNRADGERERRCMRQERVGQDLEIGHERASTVIRPRSERTANGKAIVPMAQGQRPH